MSNSSTPTMTASHQLALRNWLLILAGLVPFLIVFGGFVRLTESGLSMVEWNPLTGILPPIGEAAWQEAFDKYRVTPEFQLVNSAFTLADYKQIFLIEYAHRVIARVAGFVVALPLFYFLFKGIIPFRRSGPYLLIAVLFMAQAVMGWYMVKSGLSTEPMVSPYRLAVHLLLALALLAIILRQLLSVTQWMTPVTDEEERRRLAPVTLGLLALTIIQIAYGGMVAGFEGGDVSDTFPLMFGRWIPTEVSSPEGSWWQMLPGDEIVTHFIHRWLAFGVLLLSAGLFILTARRPHHASVVRLSRIILAIVGFQVGLGITVILFLVPLPLALLHQASGVLLFGAVFTINYILVSKQL